MKRKALTLLSVLSLPVMIACGGLGVTPEALAARIGQTERVLGSTHEVGLATLVYGHTAVEKKEKTDRLVREILVVEAQRAEDARLAKAEAERLAAVEAERVLQEQRAEARRAAVAKTAKTQRERSASTSVQAAPARSSASRSGGGACGGDLPPCSVMQKESGGSPTAIGYGQCEGGRNCYGKWQMDPVTSQSLGYSKTMDQYDEATQDEAARKLLARDGCGQWSTC